MKPPRAEHRISHKPRRRSKTAFIVSGLLVVLTVLIIGRLALPRFIRDYVNRTLDRSQIYRGKIGDVDVNLWRGAYAIHDVRLVKLTGDVPVPLFAARRVEFGIQWNAILHRKIVGTFRVDEPEINFVDAPSGDTSQTGAGGPWLQIIRDLFPFKINSAEVYNGSIHFRTFQTAEPVDIYISHLEASVDNLTNVRDELTPLLTTIEARGLAMDEAKFEFKVRLDPFSYRPTFHMAMRLLGLDVTKINDFALEYGKFDFKRGWFDLVVEMDSKEGQATGYVKPLFRNLRIFYPLTDLREDNPLQFFWQAIVGAGTRLLTNPPRDQFGTYIPFHVDENTTAPDILATIGNVLRNAFIRAYLPKLENIPTSNDTIEFDPPSLTDPISPGDAS